MSSHTNKLIALKKIIILYNFLFIFILIDVKSKIISSIYPISNFISKRIITF